MIEQFESTIDEIIEQFHPYVIEAKLLAERSLTETNDLFEGLTAAFDKREGELLDVINKQEKVISSQDELIEALRANIDHQR